MTIATVFALLLTLGLALLPSTALAQPAGDAGPHHSAQRLFAEGEFDVIVVGTSGEKRYTVKRKHFERLPL